MATRKYEQTVRAESAEQTRRRIVDAAIERLRAAPTEPISVDEVAKAAQVARSTVYLVFGSRAGLFDAVANDVLYRAGFERVVEAVAHPDAREHLRRGLRAGVDVFAADRDVNRALYSMAALDSGPFGEGVRRLEQRRAGGMVYLAQRLAEQGLLRPDVTEREAADLLWLLTSFDGFDQLYTGRGMTVDQVAETLVTTAERSLLHNIG